MKFYANLNLFYSVPDGLSADDNIVSQNGKSAGKFRNSVGKYGLGLVRMAEIKGTMSVKNKDDKSYNVQIKPPSWWPVDEQKGYLWHCTFSNYFSIMQ